MAKRRKILYVWSETTGKRVSSDTRKRNLNISVDGVQLFGAARQRTLAKWRRGFTQTGKRKKLKPRRRRKARKSKKLVGGVPRQFTSPFRKFLFNLNKLKPRQRVQVFALVEVEFTETSPRRGIILPPRTAIMPFPLGTMTRKQAEKLTDDDISRMYRREGRYIRTVGIVGLLPRGQRKGIKIR